MQINFPREVVKTPTRGRAIFLVMENLLTSLPYFNTHIKINV